MYYQERVIDGYLCYKNTPRGEWIRFSDRKLNQRIVELEKRLLEEFKKGE